MDGQWNDSCILFLTWKSSRQWRSRAVFLFHAITPLIRPLAHSSSSARTCILPFDLMSPSQPIISTSESTSVSGTGRGDRNPVVLTKDDHQSKDEDNGRLKTVGDDVESKKGVAADAAIDGPSKPSPRSVHGFSWTLVVASILMANFLFATDNTIAANIQPAVIQTFQSLNKLAWLGVAFMMSSWGTCFFW